MTTDELKKAVLEISEYCESNTECEECPFWDGVLGCRLQASWPQSWWLDDWRKKRDEST